MIKKVAFFVLIMLLIIVGVITNNSNKINTPKKEAQMALKKLTKCEEKLKAYGDSGVNLYDGESKPIDYSNFPEAKTYYTVISKFVSEGPNFAGHFTVASWGCGTDCVVYAVIDAKTGKIISYSGANNNYHLGAFSLNERVLILNPVHKGEDKKYYIVTEEENGEEDFKLFCTELAEEDTYGSPD